MNRIRPSSSELHIANADGTGERKFLDNSVFDYHACYSADGKWVLFTSGATGSANRTSSARTWTGRASSLITGPSVDDAAMSPDRIVHRLRFHARRLQGQYLGP